MRDATFDADAFFVDAGLSYSGTPVGTITGLDHLEGQVVAVVGDGAVVYNGDPAGAQAAAFTVNGGQVILPASYARIHAGLPIRYPEIELLDLDVAGSSVRDKQKRVGSVTLLLDKSSRGFLVGSDRGHLIRDVLKPSEAPVDLFTGPVDVNITATWNMGGRLVIRQDNPLPLTIIGILPNLDVGG